ncbi:MAG: putative toxin-antitoxin system toxin component, PIN family [Limisphaerales bacterium]
MKVVLDTCVLKLATFPSENNASALVFQLARAGLAEAWASPAMLEEYADVLADRPDFVAEIVENCRICHPLTELRIIRHEPDNRFVECAFAANADFIVTVNTAPGHFDRERFQTVRVVTPGQLLNLPEVRPLVRQLAEG